MKTPENLGREPIAIVGMSCRLPGAADADALWELVVNLREGVGEYPGGRTPDLDAFYRRVGMPDGPASIRGGFLSGIDTFDAAFFEVSPREAEWLDPQQRLLLEAGWEAFEDAGITQDALAKTKAGVFVGVWNNEYEQYTAINAPIAEFFRITGGLLFGTSSRIAFQFDLRGPDVSVNASCGSSLVAVHLAVRSLRSGECSIALAGGVNVIATHETTQAFSRAKMLSPDGRCKFGDASADGFVRSDGVGMLVLKRLADAQKDGDRILTVIRGTALTNDGRGSGFLVTPSAAGQQQAMIDALADAGVDPASIDLVEAHGTGTRAGDPVEVAAIGSVFGLGREGSSRCRIASVKSNVGHTESAAGVTSIIRTVQALRHRRFPASLHVSRLNPGIDWDAAGVLLELEGSVWERPEGGMRRASVNGLGLTGTNAHIILEEYLQMESAATAQRSSYLLPISAASGPALIQRAKDMAEALEEFQKPDCPVNALEDFCYTAAVRRTHLTYRFAVAGCDAAQLKKRLEEFAKEHGTNISSAITGAGSTPKIAFVFPGQGSQWIGMGRELLRTSSVFRRSIEEFDTAIELETGWSLTKQLEDTSIEERMGRIDVIQPVLFAMEVALAEMWRAWGVIPEAVVGHSMGEVAASCFAGILSHQDAARIICRRSALLMRVAGAGAMIVVDLSREDAQRLVRGLEDKVSVAVCNSPRSTVLAGDPGVLDGIFEDLERREIFCRWVRVDVASHSPQMDRLLNDLATAVKGVQPQAGLVPLCSTVQLGFVDANQMDAAYWVKNLREPVLFANAIEVLLANGFDTFVEMSPHPTLVPFVEQTAEQSGKSALAIGSLRRDEPEMTALLGSLGRLYAAGMEFDWRALYPAGSLAKLPAYPWQRERFWMKPSGAEGRRLKQGVGHPLVGDPLQTGTDDLIWTSKLTMDAHPWLKDHAVQGTALLPASVYVELAGMALQKIFACDPGMIEAMSLIEAAPLSQEGSIELQMIVAHESQDSSSLRFYCRSSNMEEWLETAKCLLRRAPHTAADTTNLMEWEDAEFAVSTISGTQHAASMGEFGYDFGPTFRQIDWLNSNGSYGVARIDLPRDLVRESYRLHPALLDAALQVLVRIFIERGERPVLLLPVSIEYVEWRALHQDARALYVRAKAEKGVLRGDVEIFDTAGRFVIAMRRVALHGMARTAEIGIESLLYETKWELLPDKVPQQKSGATEHWILLGDTSGIVAELSAVLHLQGISTTVVPASQLSSGDVHVESKVNGVVWVTPLDLDRGSSLAAAQRVLADGARWISQLLEANGDAHIPIWLLTRGAQMVEQEAVTNPLGTGAWGFFASLRNEQPLSAIRCIDLPEERLQNEVELLSFFLREETTEDRIALRTQGWFGARLKSFKTDLAHSPFMPLGDLRVENGRATETVRLTQRTLESLDHFELVAESVKAPDAGEVEIAVEASGLNFRDVLMALGAYKGAVGSHFGGEYAGTVLRIGEGVKRLQPGDAVLGITGSFLEGMIADRVCVPEVLVAKKPASMSFAEAAGIPCVFLTAWYGLVKLAQLQKGERVLIHSGAGGIGLAAIQIAQWIGAEVYATVSSEEKRAYLQAMGVKQIMHSRKLDFAREVMEATGGRGVDVVLNSLAGPAISVGLESLGFYGRFVEIGKRDVWQNSKIGLRPFNKNLSMFVVDLAQTVEDRREMVGSMLHEVVELFQNGMFKPEPTTVFSVSSSSKAFQFMSKGEHIGKIVIDMRDDAAMFRRDRSDLSSNATYLIVGGLGDLGMITAKTFVACGARHLVLTSRRPASDEVLRSISRMEELGAVVSIRNADVSVDGEVSNLLDEIRETMPPLRGIVHAAGVLDDGTVGTLSISKFESVMSGKVAGALAFDARLALFDLDFLLYYSSVAGILGTPGQGNYAAANAMLDGLAHRQRVQGIPAVSINWGVWGEVGLAAAAENRGARIASEGLGPLTQQEGADLLMLALKEMPVQLAAMHFGVDQWCSSHPAASRSPFLANLRRQSEGVLDDGRDIAARLSLLTGEELRTTLTNWLRQQVASVLRLDVERVPEEKVLRSLGLDSLMALELRNRLERNLRLKLSATMVWNYPTINALAAHLGGRLSKVQPKDIDGLQTAVTTKESMPANFAQPAGQSVSAGLSAAELLEAELFGVETLMDGQRN